MPRNAITTTHSRRRPRCPLQPELGNNNILHLLDGPIASPLRHDMPQSAGRNCPHRTRHAARYNCLTGPICTAMYLSDTPNSEAIPAIARVRSGPLTPGWTTAVAIRRSTGVGRQLAATLGTSCSCAYADATSSAAVMVLAVWRTTDAACHRRLSFGEAGPYRRGVERLSTARSHTWLETLSRTRASTIRAHSWSMNLSVARSP